MGITIDDLLLAPNQVQSQFPAPPDSIVDDYEPAGWSDTTLHYVSAWDNEGTRLTGLAALPAGTIRVLVNDLVGTTLDAGVIALRHEATSSSAANRFLCPADDDYLVEKNAAVIVCYDGNRSRWVVLGGSSGRQARLTGQAFHMWPGAYYSPTLVTGTLNDWAPVATALQSSTPYSSGLGLAAGSLEWESQCLMLLDTASGGATLTGMDNSNYSGTPGSLSPVKMLVNIGSGDLVLAHNSASSSTANRIFLPGGVPLTLPQYGSAMLVWTTAAPGWKCIANTSRTDGVFTFVSVSDLRFTDEVTPSVLTSGARQDDWSPGGNVIRAQTSGSGAANLGGLVGPGTGLPVAQKGKVVVLRNFGPGTINLLHQDTNSAASNRFYCPGLATRPVLSGEQVILQYDQNGSWWIT